ncbi:MAG: PQQ-dependent sugar dehydrogenase [Vicinamibacterales bacterium]
MLVLAPRLAAIGLVVAFQVSSTQACDEKTPVTTPAPTPSPDPTPGIATEYFTAADGTRYGVQIVAKNLELPWSLAWTPDGRLFFTERPGRVRVYQNGAVSPSPMLTLGDVFAQGEAGALGLTLHPDFATNRFVYLYYTARRDDGTPVNRVVRFREVGNTLGEPLVVIDGIPAATIHDGGRVKFGPDRKLYITAGDAADAQRYPQDLAALAGKILRLNEDGSVPADNPFRSPVYSYGHRNPQGLDWHPTTGDLWETEHGNVGNDEVNMIQAGQNYGWPLIEGAATRAGMVSPLLTFTPSVAPSGASFYTGSQVPGFKNNFFFGCLGGAHIHRVQFDPTNLRRVISHEKLLENKFSRIRDIVNGPDGALYFCTSNRAGTFTADDDRIGRIVAAP